MALLCVLRFFEWQRTSKKNKQPFFAFFRESRPTVEMLELATLEKEYVQAVYVCVCVCVCVWHKLT